MHESNDMFLGGFNKAYFLCLIVGFMHGLAFSAEQGEAEIAALIGQGVWSLSEPGTGQSSGWYKKGGRTLNAKLSLFEYYRDKQAILLIAKQDGIISDVRLLPMSVMNYQVRDKVVIFLDPGRRYGLVPHCKDSKKPDGIVIGLARPEKGREACVHWTADVRNAWEVDRNTGRLIDISVGSVSCYLADYPDSCE